MPDSALTQEKTVEVAMQMIVHAGDGRAHLSRAVDALLEGNGTEAVDEELRLAREEINTAHVAQTSLIQDSIAQGVNEYHILFSHAQDTLMTVLSEQNMVKQMIRLYRKLEGANGE
jgi:PTS system cellobiose-specific IIA component